MHERLLVRGARQLLTLRATTETGGGFTSADLGIIHDGSVLIENGRIVQVGPSRRIDNLAAAKDAAVLEVPGAVVMPALIDAHAAAGEAGGMTRRLCQVAAQHGTSVLSLRATQSALRALITPVDADLPLRLIPNADDAVASPAKLQRLAPRTFVSLDLGKPVHGPLKAYRVRGIGLRTYRSAHSGDHWLGLALALGADVVDVGALRQEEVLLLAGAQVPCVVVPQEAGSVRDLLHAGCTVGLGSGFGLPGGFTASLFAAMDVLYREHEIHPAEALRMCTLHAAMALGIQDDYGSIETGKVADLLVLQIPDYRDLVSFQGCNLIARTVRAGKLFS